MAPSPVKSPPKPKPNHRTNKNNVQQSGSGWFGGIWDKLALRPKNQMKLPDDKNPSVSTFILQISYFSVKFCFCFFY